MVLLAIGFLESGPALPLIWLASALLFAAAAWFVLTEQHHRLRKALVGLAIVLAFGPWVLAWTVWGIVGD
jgi:hypothetical protein